MNWRLLCLALILILELAACSPGRYWFGEAEGDPESLDIDEDERTRRSMTPLFTDYFIKSKPAVYSHDYTKLVGNSILFYAAQRSGNLPGDNPIPWRDDSCLDDKAKDGTDLTGGWYDAGDNVKFNFPMAWSTSVLAWGFVEFMDAYKEAGLVDDMLDSIRWPCEYFKKCHSKRNPNVYYYQVGDADIDHTIWDRPESIDYKRTVYKMKGSDNGTDVIGLTAAALASCTVAFREAGKRGRAKTFEQQAEDLYALAKKSLGCYPSTKYYKNDKWQDEQLWAALWLYQATNKEEYLTEAEEIYEKNRFLRGRSWAFGWSDTREASKLLLYSLTGNSNYKTDVMKYLEAIMPYSSPSLYSPKGLFFRHEWGSLRYAAGASMIALVAAKYGMNPNVYREFACNQTNYMLGDNESRSFVIGYGTNPPCQPHHRASSCPDLDIECTNSNSFNFDGCNHHELVGALVGGPNKNDEYTDDRKNFVQNEVACDYNAAFQGVMAGLQVLQLNNDLPPSCFILSELL